MADVDAPESPESPEDGSRDLAVTARFTRRTVIGAMAATAAVAGGAGVAAGKMWADDGGSGAVPASSSRTVKIDRTPVTPFPRAQHATALLAGGLVLCIGGVSPDGTLASCQVYNPENDEWYDASPLARPRSWHSATPMQDGRILVLGGNDNGALTIASIFDPATNEWTRGEPLKTPRYNHAATPLPDGRVVLTGGLDTVPLVRAEIYDPR
jgi:hypothetical protein